MARVEISGFQELAADIEGLVRGSTEVLEEMIEAGAQVVVKEQKKQARSMLKGKYYKGDVAGGIYAKKPVKSKDGISQTISFKGTVKDKHHKKGTSVGEIAYINEYGKNSQPARPFIRTANAVSEEEAVKAEEKVFDNYLQSKGM